MSLALPTRWALVIACAVVCGGAWAQSPAAPDKSAKAPAAVQQLVQRREKSSEELATELKAHREWELRRRQMLDAWALKRVACKHEADEKKLHLLKRWRFVKQCVNG
jgi:hypothetical protein